MPEAHPCSSCQDSDGEGAVRVLRFQVEGLDCAEEVALLRSALGSRVTEQDLDFDVLRGRMTLRVPHDGGLGVEEVQRLVRPTGLKAHVLDPEGDSRASSLRNRVRWVLCLLSGALAASGLAVHAMQHGFVHALVGGSEGAGFPPVPCSLASAHGRPASMRATEE